jgi:uncharacterized protein
VLAVCSCTVLPLFAGIYKRGAGLGPAVAFLYSGPAINVLAIILTARVLGFEMGVARAVGAIAFSVVIGLLMHLIFRREELATPRAAAGCPAEWRGRSGRTPSTSRPWSASWSSPTGGPRSRRRASGTASTTAKWWLTASALAFAAWSRWFGLRWWKVADRAGATALAAVLAPHEPLIPFAVGGWPRPLGASTSAREAGDWFAATWGFAKQILPLLLLRRPGRGAAAGPPGHEGLIPSEWVSRRWAATRSAPTSSRRSPARSCTSRRSPRCRSSRG